ncbi:MAG: c-type cytochrome [Pseudomonadota bacterium]|nr:c-type cytochrome [Pseudomonadota bacterium]
MTDAHEPNSIDGPHEGPIKTPKQLILAVFYAFVVPILGIILLVMFVTTDSRPGAGSDASSAQSIAERIRRVGVVEVKDAGDVTTMKTGEQVFAAQCTACHTAGLLGAPKFGDATAWSPRIKSGYAALLNSALHGKNQMPPQGGGDFSDFEVGRAVVYMANKSGASFAEPAAPAAAASGAVGAATAAAPDNGSSPSNGSAARVAVAAPVAVAVPATSTTSTVAATPVAGNAGAAAPAVYSQVCSVCHAAGIAGAPKLGDKAAWAPRVAQGIDGLTASAIKGKGAMPPRGGSTASDADIKTVVTYMVNAVK